APKYLFRLPKKGDDKDDAELKIFEGLGGTVEQNVERWKGSFVPPKGKSIDDVAKLKKTEIGDWKVAYLDISGTYKFRDMTKPNAKEELRPDYRMLAVQANRDKDKMVYHFKLVGPANTVEAHKKGLDDLLKALK